MYPIFSKSERYQIKIRYELWTQVDTVGMHVFTQPNLLEWIILRLEPPASFPCFCYLNCFGTLNDKSFFY